MLYFARVVATQPGPGAAMQSHREASLAHIVSLLACNWLSSR